MQNKYIIIKNKRLVNADRLFFAYHLMKINILFLEVIDLKRKYIGLAFVPVVFILTMCLYKILSKEEPTKILPDTASISAYTESFGWQIDEEEIKFTEITIPYIFNDTYKEYNKIQKKQGFDLEKYKGKKVTLITCLVTNFTDGEKVYIELITENTCLIGANLKSYGKNGFIKPLNINEL